jgi:UDP-N-acetylmuramyl tripeptide synthase
LTLTNLFRDQLDRYGEVDLLAGRWTDAVSALPASATLVVNVDDPLLARVAESAHCGVLAFGVDDPSAARPDLPHEADSRLCPLCGRRIAYTLVYYGHLGHYVCRECGWRRPDPNVSLRSVTAAGDGLRLSIAKGAERAEVNLPMTGLYNAYNGLAAAAICAALEIPLGKVGNALSTFGGVFGRQERVAVGAGHLVLTLVKNPVGFNQVLQSLGVGGWGLGASPQLLVFAINDLLADGTDVSWLWDVDFEVLASLGTDGPSPQPSPRGRGGPKLICTGLRAHDMALRLKYAMANREEIVIEPRIKLALSAALEAASRGGSVPVFATYTAMLEARQVLGRWGYVPPFWMD